ncbi:MFS general substrate transporter [Neoconidiobolus thromboides FSU 785]|nr:MFS general substrate transporter [Neoconidiobolus thromboides FSU 785]
MNEVSKPSNTIVMDEKIEDSKLELGSTAEENSVQYSKFRRSIILLVIAFAAILAPLSSTIYFPSLGEIREELVTTDLLVDISISVYMLTLGLAPLVWGGMADRFGRKGVFLVTQVIFTIGNIGCALSNSIGLLIAMRIIQGIGASAPIVTGIGTITDIFPRQEQGFAMSVFFVGPLVGPVIGPIIGGFLFDAFGWRSTFWTLTILGGILLVASVFLLPETLAKSAKQEFPIKITLKPLRIRKGGKMFNPLSPLGFLRFPIVVIPCICIAITFGTFFAVESSMSRVFPSTYNLTASQSGLTFIPLGVGSILGNLLGGKICDRSFRRFKAKNNGNDPRPEVRFYGLWSGSLIEAAGLLMTAWFVTYQFPLAASLTAGFLIGFGNTMSIISCSSYLVDNFPDYASSIAACFSAFEMVITAIITAINALILDGLGYGGGITLYACLVLCVTITIFLMYYKGESIRKRFGPYNSA